MRWLAAFAALAAASSCVGRYAPSCRSDNECAAEEVCFADGCGDPGKDLAVEVVPNRGAGHEAQDFLLPQIHAVEDLALLGPSALEGKLEREEGNTTDLYSGAVSFSVSGESEIIPGIIRRYEANVQSNDGRYSFPVGAGRFTLTATPDDKALPPALRTGIAVQPGTTAMLNFAFPGNGVAVGLSGKLLHTAALGALEEPMEIQALDAQSQRPISQRVPVGENGDFTVRLSPDVPSIGTVLLQVNPQDPDALVPKKLFPVPVLGSPQLEMGAFGSPLDVTGRLLDSQGAPLADAVLYLSGMVNGGGTFRSESVRTGSDGKFKLRSLPGGETGDGYFLWAVPPATSNSGVLRAPVQIASANTALGELRCPDKLLLQGIVHQPDGAPFPDVQIAATPMKAVEGRPLPAFGAEASTGPDGRFSIRLDPAEYRFDFLSRERLPRISRYIAVPATSPNGAAVDLASFEFSKGRRVTGKVTALPSRLAGDRLPAPYAAVRFFRVTVTPAGRSAVLLAEGVADSSAEYSVILPTR